MASLATRSIWEAVDVASDFLAKEVDAVVERAKLSDNNGGVYALLFSLSSHCGGDDVSKPA